MGYEWGGAIALKLALENPKSFEKVVAIMPSYSESDQTRDELRKLRTPTMIHWIPQDHGHPWHKFKRIAWTIPNVTIELTNINLWNAEISKLIY